MDTGLFMCLISLEEINKEEIRKEYLCRQATNVDETSLTSFNKNTQGLNTKIKLHKNFCDKSIAIIVFYRFERSCIVLTLRTKITDTKKQKTEILIRFYTAVKSFHYMYFSLVCLSKRCFINLSSL